jgi:hypothetical protein
MQFIKIYSCKICHKSSVMRVSKFMTLLTETRKRTRLKKLMTLIWLRIVTLKVSSKTQSCHFWGLHLHCFRLLMLIKIFLISNLKLNHQLKQKLLTFREKKRIIKILKKFLKLGTVLEVFNLRKYQLSTLSLTSYQQSERSKSISL